MQTVKFETVWQNILRLLQKPAGVTLQAVYEAQLLVWVNQKVREGWIYGPWPQLLLTEERAFRPAWNSAVAYTGGAERYRPDTDKYYVALRDNTGAAPESSPADWREMTSAELSLYLPWNPPDLYPLGIVNWVGLNDPDRYADKRYSLPFHVARQGVYVLGSNAGTKVWVRHRMRPNAFSRTTLAQGAQPIEGSLYLNATDGQCYQAVTLDGANEWARMDFPDFLQSFVELAVVGVDLQWDGQKDKGELYLGMAQAALEREWQAQVDQQGQ